MKEREREREGGREGGLVHVCTLYTYLNSPTNSDNLVLGHLTIIPSLTSSSYSSSIVLCTCARDEKT